MHLLFRLPKKIRRGLGSVFRINAGYSLPPLIATKEPKALNTRRNASGRSQAAVKAQIPPLLAPAMARSLGFFEKFNKRPSVVF